MKPVENGKSEGASLETPKAKEGIKEGNQEENFSSAFKIGRDLSRCQGMVLMEAANVGHLPNQKHLQRRVSEIGEQSSRR